jgi:hypothetical protein
MVREVPGLYVQIENMLRQLRVCHRDNQKNQQRVFYTLEELEDELKSFLLQLKISKEDLEAAVNFMHQVL